MFGSIFSSVFGRDCSDVESDPRADPFDKEICRSMREFEDIFGDMRQIFEREQDEPAHQEHDDSPQSLRDQILSKPHYYKEDTMKRPQYEDRNLDHLIKDDPKKIDEIMREKPDKDKATSHSTSIRISTIIKPDGSTEYRKTVRDSDGNEQTTVTNTRPERQSRSLRDWIFSK